MQNALHNPNFIQDLTARKESVLLSQVVVALSRLFLIRRLTNGKELSESVILLLILGLTFYFSTKVHVDVFLLEILNSMIFVVFFQIDPCK